jgi:hypothetical protein
VTEGLGDVGPLGVGHGFWRSVGIKGDQGGVPDVSGRTPLFFFLRISGGEAVTLAMGGGAGELAGPVVQQGGEVFAAVVVAAPAITSQA